MKKRIPMLCAAVLALLLLLSACASSEALLSFGKTGIDRYMYRYFASSYKGIYSRSIQGYSDTDEFWDAPVNGEKTVCEILDAEVVSHVKKTLICAELYDRLGYRLSDERVRSVDERLDQLQDDYGEGSLQKLNQLLLPYGVNREILRKIYLMEEKVDALEEALFSSGGELEITEEERDLFYRENYVRVRLIFLRTESKYLTDEEGNPVYDLSTGSYVLEELTDREKEEKQQRIAYLEEHLTEASFDEYEKSDSELSSSALGKAYVLDSFTSSLAFLFEAASSLEVGEIRKVTAENGVYFVLRCASEEKGYLSEEESDYYDSFEEHLRYEKYLRFIGGYEGEVAVNEEALREFSLKNVTANYDY
ncbi:MAG: hypothetical protein II797_01765 [Clostridia bacterium]|nr:hypothetical protein [Clostridia bacterium]